MIFKILKLFYKLVRCILDLILLFLYTLWVFLISPITFLCSFRQKSLKDEVILITGSAAGIGRATCLELARLEKSISFICWDMSPGPNESLVKELEKMGVRRAVAMTVDVTKEPQVQAAYKQACSEVGGVTMLINNAGICGKMAPLWELDSATTQKIIDVNLTSHFWTLKAVMPDMLARGQGHIVTTCSILGHMWARYAGPYVASKFGVRGYLECLKEDIRHHDQKADIKFTTAYPFFCKTNLIADFNFKLKYDFIPWNDPEETAKALVRGIRRNQEHLFIPEAIRFGALYFAVSPSSIVKMALRIFDIRVKRTSEKSSDPALDTIVVKT